MPNMQLASILIERCAYPLVLAKSTSVTVNGGDRRREGRRGQASDNSRFLKQTTGSAIPTPRHPERAAPSEQVLGAEFSRWRSGVAPSCSTESSPSFDYGLKLTFPKDLTRLTVSDDR
ncbi:hypothetical protein K443DRAFT_686853 [Laccaria amethystina LaAM-08-1]|uniref:Uncharacterized protein n=1 Tax=Laccaria amethystina LaAM-08-1 TaxID=1095629 RepID=A0A0C9WR50_9AGAR|nr:hypothetical protein K443DRAFT_686853 [Laccaria amethystina LaAM-08-1]